jgi:hypothetical protein
VYSILTTLLALIYFGGVALLQMLVPRLTGNPPRSWSSCFRL